MKFRRDTAKGIGQAIIIVPLALPAFFLAFLLRLFSGGTINLDDKLVNLINKYTAPEGG